MMIPMYCMYGESLMPYSWFEQIIARRELRTDGQWMARHQISSPDYVSSRAKNLNDWYMVHNLTYFETDDQLENQLNTFYIPLLYGVWGNVDVAGFYHLKLPSFPLYWEVWQVVKFLVSGPRFNIKMSSYQYRKSQCGDKTVVRSSYLHNGISYTGKISFLYWIGAQIYNIWI